MLKTLPSMLPKLVLCLLHVASSQNSYPTSPLKDSSLALIKTTSSTLIDLLIKFMA
jgi:hypothetical protein